jgi:photosystem II stability/assembly factor-like uncharacterized protein
MRIKTLLSSAFLLALVATAQTAGRRSGPWELEVSGTTAGLRGIHAVSGGVVWASGTHGTVLRSEDSGYEWQQCTMPADASKLDFRGVWGWDAQTALVMSSGPGDQSRLYRTIDGCSSWKLIFSNPDSTNTKFPGFWDGILFFDQQRGLIYGDPVPDSVRTNRVGDGRFVVPVQRTQDGGKSWTPDPNLKAQPGESFFAASNSAMTANNGWIWIGTSNARVLRSRDGVDWQSALTPLASGNDSSGVFSLAFRDQQHGMAVGGDYRKPDDATGTAAYTSDGGAYWSAARKPPHGYRSTVAWDATNRAWITAGSNGSDISYDDGKTWQWLDSGNWNALSLPWAVGPNGQIGKMGTLPAKAATPTAVSR